MQEYKNLDRNTDFSRSVRDLILAAITLGGTRNKKTLFKCVEASLQVIKERGFIRTPLLGYQYRPVSVCHHSKFALLNHT